MKKKKTHRLNKAWLPTLKPSHSPTITVPFSLHGIPGIGDLPRGLHPQQCGFCPWALPTSRSTCRAQPGSPTPVGGEASVSSPFRPANGFERTFRSQAGSKLSVASQPTESRLELTEMRKATREKNFPTHSHGRGHVNQSKIHRKKLQVKVFQLNLN